MFQVVRPRPAAHAAWEVLRRLSTGRREPAWRYLTGGPHRRIETDLPGAAFVESQKEFDTIDEQSRVLYQQMLRSAEMTR